jgi:RNase P subunit RPR2
MTEKPPQYINRIAVITKKYRMKLPKHLNHTAGKNKNYLKTGKTSKAVTAGEK